jgi:hypothetical protein
MLAMYFGEELVNEAMGLHNIVLGGLGFVVSIDVLVVVGGINLQYNLCT